MEAFGLLGKDSHSMSPHFMPEHFRQMQLHGAAGSPAS
jgi:hypothetical protein